MQREFDDYASYFDEKLVGSLGYRVPQAIAELLGHLLSETARGSLAILDAGCGTGLCGPHLRPWAKRLDGVDLSSKMLERAARRGAYDHLERAELTAFISASPHVYDAIVAAGVFVYFGDLRDVGTAAAARLRPGGLLVFSVAALSPDTSGDWRINPSGRYAHSERYVRRIAEDIGFDVRYLAEAVARHDSGRPVPSLLAAMSRR